LNDRAPYQVAPDLAPADYEALKADIKDHGVQVAVEYDQDGNIIDGHHRVRACEELGLKDWPRVVRPYSDDVARRSQARRLNMNRRHLKTADKRKMIEDELRENPGQANRVVAEKLGVSHNTVIAARDGLASTGQIDQLTKTTGKDGKARPTKPRKPKAPKPAAAPEQPASNVTVLPTAAKPAEAPTTEPPSNVVKLGVERIPTPTEIEQQVAAADAGMTADELGTFEHSKIEDRALAITHALNTFDHVQITGKEFWKVYGKDPSKTRLIEWAKKARVAIHDIIEEYENNALGKANTKKGHL
jgi:hypothetical protein